MSVFLGLELANEVRAAVEQTLQPYRELRASWVRPEKWHLTLAFLGSPPTESFAELRRLTDGVAKQHRAFSICLAGSGLFATARAPSVLWLGVEGELGTLAAVQETAMTQFNPHLQHHEVNRPWTPHVTLARAKRAGMLDEVCEGLREFKTVPFNITELVLFESTNSEFSALHRARLGVALRDPVSV